MPQFKRTSPVLQTPVLLNDRITTEDVRKIFDSLNQDNRLSTLSPWVLEATDSELSTFAELISRYFYEEAFLKQGLLSLIENRIERKSFSQLKKVQSEIPELQPHRLREILNSLFFLPEFPEVIERDVGFLDENWLRLVSSVHRTFSENTNSRFLNLPQKALSSEQYAEDITRFFSDPSLRAELVKLFISLEDYDFGADLLKSLHALGQKHHGPKAFEGFALGIRRMLLLHHQVPGKTPHSYLGLLFNFFQIINQPTDGLFIELEKNLSRSAPLFGEFGSAILPMVPRAVSGFIRETLCSPQGGDPPPNKNYWIALGSKPLQPSISPEFIALFKAVQTGIENVRGPAADGFSRDYFLANLPLLLNTYVLSKWIEHVARTNLTLLKKMDEKDFPAGLWNLQITTPEFSQDLIEQNSEGNWVLSNSTKNDFSALGMNAFVAELEVIARKEGYGDFLYSFSEQRQPIPFKKALTSAAEECHRIRQFSDSSSFLRSLFFKFTRKEEPQDFSLADLESPNLLDDLNQIMAGFSIENLRKFKKVLFDDLHIGKLSRDDRELLLRLFSESPGHLKKIEGLLNSVQMLYELDFPVDGLPSIFETYHCLLSKVGPSEVQSISEILSFVSQSGFVPQNDLSPARFPALLSLLENGEGTFSLLHFLSKVPPNKRATFLKPLQSAFGLNDASASGMETHLKVASSLSERNADSFKALTKHLIEGVQHLLSGQVQVDKSERALLSRFISEGDFRTLWMHLSRYFKREGALALIRELRSLSLNGSLREAFLLLSYFQNERFNRISSTLRKWDNSGELLYFLETLEAWLKPSEF